MSGTGGDGDAKLSFGGDTIGIASVESGSSSSRADLVVLRGNGALPDGLRVCLDAMRNSFGKQSSAKESGTESFRCGIHYLSEVAVSNHAVTLLLVSLYKEHRRSIYNTKSNVPRMCRRGAGDEIGLMEDPRVI